MMWHANGLHIDAIQMWSSGPLKGCIGLTHTQNIEVPLTVRYKSEIYLAKQSFQALPISPETTIKEKKD